MDTPTHKEVTLFLMMGIYSDAMEVPFTETVQHGSL